MRQILAPALIAAALLLPGTASAQMSGGAGGMPRGPMMPPEASGPARRPPPALPGLVGRQRPAPIPSETPSGSLSPNIALFDAINRGDMAAARDAMSRGADLDSRNQLGLTPIDAAVDQGRNEIAFFLLATRGTARYAGPPPEQAAATPPPARGSRREAARNERGGRNGAPRGAAPAERTADSSPSTGSIVPPGRPNFPDFDPNRPLSAPPRGGAVGG